MNCLDCLHLGAAWHVPTVVVTKLLKLVLNDPLDERPNKAENAVGCVHRWKNSYLNATLGVHSLVSTLV